MRLVAKSAIAVAVAVSLFNAVPAVAMPVADNLDEYSAFGRVFPDPLGGCVEGVGVCSPNAKGHVPAAQFIQWQEFLDGIKFLNSRDEWRRYMEVLVLDGKLGDGPGTTGGESMFPGNNLKTLEYTPKPEYRSAGLPTSTVDRKHSDLIVVRVTDESVPDKGKKRMALALSIHGIERAGIEGGTRAVEDLVTAQSTGTLGSRIVSEAVKQQPVTFGDVLKNTIIYFTYPNPDGWRRGSISEGGVFFQRYNGNGVDLNRDWPDIGYSNRGYSGVSEPETRAFYDFYRDVEANGGHFAAGDDLHGQASADALSYTMLPHGRHDWGKDQRLRATAITINRGTYDAIKWSPYIQPNEAPQPTCTGASVLQPCTKLYAQTWGTVYDTINYTTTGTLGDWFDSRAGLNADGIDNEMSFSHLDRNIVFDPHGEQLHVDGNKSLIYAHLADIVVPPATQPFAVPGAKGYAANDRLKREAQETPRPPKHSVPQDDIVNARGVADLEQEGQTVFPFRVYSSEGRRDTPGIYNGGMRVDITTTNAHGIGTGSVELKVQCKGCDAHDAHSDDWVTVAEDFNQSFFYAQAGITAAINRPKASPEGVEWRAVVSQGTAITRMDVDFTTGPATTDGSTSGGEDPALAGYDVANTDVFADLNKFVPNKSERFRKVGPDAVLSGSTSLGELSTLVLADNPMPGYRGAFDGEDPPPVAGPTTADQSFSDGGKITGPGQGASGCTRNDATTNYHNFVVAPEHVNARLDAVIRWESNLNDWDMYLERRTDGGWEQVTQAQNSFLTTSEALFLEGRPVPAGTYRLAVTNCASRDPHYTGRLTFTGYPEQQPSAFTAAEKEAWFAKLREYVGGGGNLVLTDGALRVLPELTNIMRDKITRRLVYAGQTSFATASGATPTSGPNTLSDELAKDVKQPGARFNTNLRRQTFEPSPLGFFVDSSINTTARVGSPQWDVDRVAFEAAGGRVVGSGMTSTGTNVTMQYGRVTLGEIKMGSGTIRISGGLLPQPSAGNDHPLGIEPHALTYTGYILLRNLVQPASG